MLDFGRGQRRRRTTHRTTRIVRALAGAFGDHVATAFVFHVGSNGIGGIGLKCRKLKVALTRPVSN